MAESWRVVMVCTIKPIADVLAGKLRELGHEPVAILAARRDDGDEPPDFLRLSPASAPAGRRPALRARQARDRAARARLRARPADVLGLSVEDPAGGARRAASRLDQPAPGAAAAAPRADPARVGAPRRRRRVGLDLAPDGRRARHRQHARPDDRSRSGTTTSTSPSSGRAFSPPGRGMLPARARARRCRRPGRPAAGGGRELGGALHGRRLRPDRLVAHGAADPQPGARVAPHVRHVRACARRSPSSTARRWCCSRRGSPTRAATRAASSAATGRSGSSSTSRCSRSNRDRQAEIYLMNPDGSGQKRLTIGSGDDWASVFSPDGALIDLHAAVRHRSG